MSWSDFKAGLARITGTDDPSTTYAYTPLEAVARTSAQLNPALQLFGAILPGTAGDFGVGAARIASGTVGEGDNPTWGEAWRDTDTELAQGWLPGGAESPLNQWWDDHGDDVEDAGKRLLTVAAIVGAAIVASR